MARLPQPGGDSGTWGYVLNEYLSQAHKSDGTLKDNAVTANALAPNSVSNAAIASDAVNATSIADGTITEALLDSAVQIKLNVGSAPDWGSIQNKPAVMATGADQATARGAIGAVAFSVDGSPVGTYDLDTTPPTPSDIGAYSATETDAAIAAAVASTASSTETLTNKTITSPKVNRILDTNGDIVLYLAPVGSAVNYLQIDNGSGGNSPSFESKGTATNLGFTFIPKGSGGLLLYEASGQTTAQIFTAGTATNINMNLITQGTGVVKANNVDLVLISGAQVLTNKDLSSVTNTFPTFNQNTTGSAAKLTTARNIDGVAFDGTANITTVKPSTVGPNYYQPGYISGQYYFCNGLQAPTSGTMTLNRVRVTPWIVTASLSVIRIFIEFTVAGSADSLFRIGVWNDDGTGQPGSLLFEAGTISTGSSNAGTVATGGIPGVYEITVSQTIPPGMYWVGGVAQGTSQATVRAVNAASQVVTYTPMGSTLPGANANGLGFYLDGVSGSLGGLTGATTGSTSAPRVGFKVA